MKSPAKCAAWLLPLLLSGCILHKPVQSHNSDLPYVPPVENPVTLQVASLELPPKLTVIPARPIVNMREQPVPIKPTIKHRLLHRSDEDAAITPSPNITPAIGQLSSADPGNSRGQIEDSIASIERGLNGINRTLDDVGQKTANNIREDLKQAKAALASGDVEGARTLASKAKALLDELSK